MNQGINCFCKGGTANPLARSWRFSSRPTYVNDTTHVRAEIEAAQVFATGMNGDRETIEPKMPNSPVSGRRRNEAKVR